MPVRYLDSPGPTLGMIRDLPSWKLPAEAVYDQLNVLNDFPGMARQRGGSTAIVSGAQTAFATSLGFCRSDDPTALEELYGYSGKGGIIYNVNKTTGVNTSLGVSVGVGTVGRPVQHFGFLAFPGTGSAGLRSGGTVAGATTSASFTSGVVSQIAAGNQQITLTGADVTTNVQVGGVVTVYNATNLYYGRVVSVDTTKKFTVNPTPTFTDAAIPIAQTLVLPSFPIFPSGSCAASFQTRLLYGNTNDLGSTGQTLVADRRVNYSPLPTETFTFGARLYGGATFVSPAAWPVLNYFEVPGSDPIVAMEPLTDNALLILTGNQPVILDGNLATQLATTNPTITFDESSILQPAGCLSDLSVQRTPRGIVWAGVSGVHAYNGGRTIDDLTDKRINSYWRSLTSDAALVIHGSAYVRNHYIVSGTSGGTTFSLACNMQNLQWTRLSGVGTDNFFAVARPTNRAQVYASRWWDQTGAAPSMTNGQTIRLESMFAPYTTGATKTDADGTAVTLSMTTPVIDGGRPQTQKIAQRLTVRHQQSSTTAAVTVTGQSKIDASDISAASVRALGSLSNTSVLTISNATNANPIVVTTGTHGLQTDDFVDIDGVTGNTNANGRWRIAVINTTSFSLVGGIGNGTFGGSPTCKKLTETDYLASPLNAGQGFSLKFDGAPNNWQYHGATIAVLEKEPVLST